MSLSKDENDIILRKHKNYTTNILIWTNIILKHVSKANGAAITPYFAQLQNQIIYHFSCSDNIASNKIKVLKKRQVNPTLITR